MTNNKHLATNGQTIMHILGKNAEGAKFEHLKRIYFALKEKGVNPKQTDADARNPLHYAVISRHA